MISFPCTHCGKALKIKPELAGKKVKCPGCSQATPVPAPPAEPPPPPEKTPFPVAIPVDPPPEPLPKKDPDLFSRAMSWLARTWKLHRLTTRLQKGDLSERLAAAKALAHLEDARAFQALVAALGDGKLNTLIDAMDNPRTTSYYLTVEAEEYGHDRLQVEKKVRNAAAMALGLRGDLRAVGPLLEVFATKQEYEPDHIAVRSLVKLGVGIVEPLLALFKSNTSVSTVYKEPLALVVLTKLGAVDPLAAALKDSDEKVRWAAAHVLGLIGDPRAVEPLSTVLSDSWWKVRRTAAQAMAQCGDLRGLLAALAAGDVGSIFGLSELGDEQALEPLRSFVQRAQGISILEGAVEALAAILDRNGKSASEADLRNLAVLADAVHITWYLHKSDCHPDYCAQQKTGIDCGRVRQLARQELLRRGLQV